MTILFLNHGTINCGVYQYGKRLYNILAKDELIKYYYQEVTSEEQYISVINTTASITHVIYNYHAATMRWLNKNNIQKKYINIGIPHESSHDLFDKICERRRHLVMV